MIIPRDNAHHIRFYAFEENQVILLESFYLCDDPPDFLYILSLALSFEGQTTKKP